MPKIVAYLGLGNMGGAMAANLLKNGFEVRGFDPSPAARGRAEEASGAQVICSSVPETRHAEEAYLGEKGALAAAPEGAVCFDLSTITADGSQKIAAEAQKRGIRFLDTPVSGSVPQAKAGTLALIAGGDKTALDEHADVLGTIGESVHHFGPNGAGLQMKLVTNHIFAVHISAIAEATTLGAKAGLDPEAMMAFLKASVIPKILDYKGSTMIAKDYTPTFTVNLMLKDLRMITALAEEAKVPAPLCSIARQVYLGAAALGHGDADQNAIVEYFEAGAGMKAEG